METTKHSMHFIWACVWLGTTLAQATSSEYITYDQGNCSLILSVTHGGSLRPESIPDRTVCSGSYKGCKVSGDCVYSHNHGQQNCQCQSSTCNVKYFSDTATDSITLLLQARILQVKGCKPHLVKSELQRRKLDANREQDEATFGNSDTITAYNLFHQNIEDVKATIGLPDYGLILDMHGQTHSEQWTEFGYVLPKWRITDDDYSSSARPSVCSLVMRECNGKPWNETCFRNLIRGTVSLGDRLNQHYDAMPSVQYPDTSSYNYYTGGYVTKTHGSKACTEGLNWDAVQVEMPSTIRSNSATHADYVEKLADSVIGFMDDFYSGWCQ